MEQPGSRGGTVYGVQGVFTMREKGTAYETELTEIKQPTYI